MLRVLFSHQVVYDLLWPHGLQHARLLPFTISRSLLKLMFFELVMPSNHLILCCPLLLLPSVFPSNKVFSSESTLHIRWPNYWSFSFSISPSNEYSGLISFRIDCLDLLAVQGTLKSLLQHQAHTFPLFWVLTMIISKRFLIRSSPHQMHSYSLTIYKTHTSKFPILNHCRKPEMLATNLICSFE